MEIYVITVVRDWKMYNKCISTNQNLKNCILQPYENLRINERLPTIYNRFLNEYNYDNQAWFIFCHEDFQFYEKPVDFLEKVSENFIYGPIGAVLEKTQSHILGGLWISKLLGEIEESDKAGNNVRFFGSLVEGDNRVDTLDCQCVIVHSEIVKNNNLRFDENLSFDLYVEDFCANAFVKHGIESRILPFKCRHWSQGVITERFHKLRKFLDKKYPQTEFASCTGFTFGCGKTYLRRMQRHFRRLLDFVSPNFSFLILNLIGKVTRKNNG